MKRRQITFHLKREWRAWNFFSAGYPWENTFTVCVCESRQVRRLRPFFRKAICMCQWVRIPLWQHESLNNSIKAYVGSDFWQNHAAEITMTKVKQYAWYDGLRPLWGSFSIEPVLFSWYVYGVENSRFPLSDHKKKKLTINHSYMHSPDCTLSLLNDLWSVKCWFLQNLSYVKYYQTVTLAHFQNPLRLDLHKSRNI